MKTLGGGWNSQLSTGPKFPRSREKLMRIIVVTPF